MPESPTVCVLLPTLDEAETIADVVDGYRSQGLTNILVVDGNSSDGTAEIAESHGARVVTQTGAGKGQAVREAIRKHVRADVILMADADATYLPEDAERMLAPILRGDAEHVIGDRFADMREGAMTRLNRIGNRLINRAFALIHGENLRDILSGYRAFTRESFERMRLTADGFGVETEMSVECVKRGVRTDVVPITYLPRPHGSSTNLNPLRDGGIIFLELYRRAKTHNPLFYFGSVGTASTIAGLLVAAFVGYDWFVNRVAHEVLAIVSAAGILFGVQLLMFGVLADLLLSLHYEQIDRVDEMIKRSTGRGSDGASRSGAEEDRDLDERYAEERYAEERHAENQYAEDQYTED